MGLPAAELGNTAFTRRLKYYKVTSASGSFFG
jgi:hypothetical protein